MQRPLDPHSFKKNVYERPNQEWVCGHAAEGHPCRLGPDAKGRCRATGECIPAKQGDRWMCTRIEASGGKCEQGPLPDGTCSHPIPPCQPVRSLRKARALFVWLALAVTAGALLVLFGQHFRRGWMNPGTLTHAHATSATNCSDCHSVGSLAVTPLRVSQHSLGERARNDSELCLKCHSLGDQPLKAHSVSPPQLATLTTKLSSSKPTARPALLRAARFAGAPDPHQADLACATCHQEHHGRNFELTKLSDAQCQVCHTNQFASFKKGHPEFSGYPYQRRTRIFFDHASHLQQHFAERKEVAPQNCQSCHEPGPLGRFMRVKDFNLTCAACHSAQIKGEGMTEKGVAFFSVPELDLETLAAHGLTVGEWPKGADAKVTPFMQLLLQRSPAAQAAMEKLRGVDLVDLTKATPEQLAAAEELAWQIKRLLFHLVSEGQSFLIAQFKDELPPAGFEVPRAALLAAQKEWMPDLLTEMANYEKGIKPAPPPPKATPVPSAPPAPAKAASGDDSLLGGEDLLAAAPKPSATPGDDLLGGKTAPSPKPAPADDDLTSGDLSAAQPAASATPAAPVPPTAIAAEEWVAAGGWYRPQDSFTLSYRPVGHADQFLVAWLTGAAKLARTDASVELRSSFAKLTDRQSPGLCMKCHTVEENAGAMTVNWNAAQPGEKSRPFTTFNHSTHMSVTGDAGCQSCHALNPKSHYASFFSGDAPTGQSPHGLAFESNFAPLSKMKCAECHQPRVVADSCVLCHRYHAASVSAQFATAAGFQAAGKGKVTQ